jgi:hypothetical protein
MCWLMSENSSNKRCSSSANRSDAGNLRSVDPDRGKLQECGTISKIDMESTVRWNLFDYYTIRNRDITRPCVRTGTTRTKRKTHQCNNDS